MMAPEGIRGDGVPGTLRQEPDIAPPPPPRFATTRPLTTLQLWKHWGHDFATRYL